MGGNSITGERMSAAFEEITLFLLRKMLPGRAVPGELRVSVLKDAKGRCSLCGATREMRPLDVSLVIPRSKGGKTVYENLQVLCSKCRRAVAREDSFDFRSIVDEAFDEGCPFCAYNLTGEKPLENDLAFVKPDERPLTEGHSLIIPKRHVRDWFETTKVEQEAMNELIRMRRQQLLEADLTIGGFNMGTNSGELAGQTVFHCHFHLIPRRENDGVWSKGGVRVVIRERMG